jgi:hypothetical protein
VLTFWKDVAILLASIVTLVTFFTGAWEYRLRGRQERAQYLLAMRRRFLETAAFRNILEALIAGGEAVSSLPVQDRRHFAGFLEEVGLLVHSGLIRREVAFAMFGYYIRLTAESGAFWDGLDRDGPYWSQFRQFAATVERAAAHPPRQERPARL